MSASPQRNMFANLGRWCYRRRWYVLAIWIALAVIGGGLLGVVGTESRTEFSLPDVESRVGTDILDEHFGGAGAGISAPLVFATPDGVDDPEVTAAMEAIIDEIAAFDDVVGVISPYEPDGAHQIAFTEGYAGQIAYATIELPSDFTVERAEEMAEEIRADIETHIAGIAGLEVHLGGEIFAEWEEPTAEIIGVAFAILILIVVFGSVLAMGLPIGLGLAGIAVGLILGGFVSHVLEVPDFAQMLGIMIGLGVGIDYALFIVTRFRENRRAGQDVEGSIVTAINTAGRATVFAGASVVISLLGMLIMQLGFITGMAVAVAIVVAVAMIGSVTLLPALLGFFADRIETTRWRGIIAACGVSLALLGVAFEASALSMVGLVVAVVAIVAGLFWKPLQRALPHRKQRPLERTAAYRWSRWVQHNPWPSAIGGAALLIVLALPVLGLRLGFADEGNYAEETQTRQAYDLVTDGFGAGYNGPLILAAELPAGTDLGALDDVTAALRGVDGMARVGDPFLNNPDDPAAATAVMWRAFAETSPQDEATTSLVKELRDDILPVATEASGLEVAVTGTVAINVDFSNYLAERLPYFFAAVLALSFLLLMAVFRSVLVPLKAVIMNLLGIGAAYGVIVAGFQWGWLGGLLGFDGGPIEPFMPMMLFAIVFGLSMDYEVFLLSRVKEEWDRTGDSHLSVANGVAATARVITAAALIMVVVFGAFMLGDERVIKMAGLGLAVAVLLDATVIRMLLVPATMELLGDRNWWLPRWLDRILPTIDVEGHTATEAAAAAAATARTATLVGHEHDGPDDDRELQPV